MESHEKVQDLTPEDREFFKVSNFIRPLPLKTHFNRKTKLPVFRSNFPPTKNDFGGIVVVLINWTYTFIICVRIDLHR